MAAFNLSDYFNGSLYDQQAERQKQAYDQQAAALLKQYTEQKAVSDANKQAKSTALLNGRNALLQSAQSNYDNADKLLKSNYAAGSDAQNAATERSLQQAYVSNEIAKRNLGQELAASGKSGGANESTILGLANQYGTNRGTLETSRNSALSDLASKLASSQASNTETLNTNKANYEKDYQDKLAALEDDVQTALANIENTYKTGSTSLSQTNQNALNDIENSRANALAAAQKQMAADQAAQLLAEQEAAAAQLKAEQEAAAAEAKAAASAASRSSSSGSSGSGTVDDSYKQAMKTAASLQTQKMSYAEAVNVLAGMGLSEDMITYAMDHTYGEPASTATDSGYSANTNQLLGASATNPFPFIPVSTTRIATTNPTASNRRISGFVQ